MNLEKICLETTKLSKEVGKYIYNERKKARIQSFESKGKHNFVTEIDKNSELQIIKELEKILPDSGFIAEEGTSDKKGEEYNWIIDPLDGTTNFIHGSPPVAISIALMNNKELIIGIVYEIFLNECFYTWKNAPSFLNGEIIKVSETAFVSDSLIATGFPYHNFNRIEQFMKSLEYFFTNSHGVRRLGSAATDLAYVACGRYDAFYEYNLNPWDVAAGSLLIKNAGGKISDFKGEENYLFGKEIIATCNNVYMNFLTDIKHFMID